MSSPQVVNNDRHNPEIIYYLLECQSISRLEYSYNALDHLLSREVPPNQQMLHRAPSKPYRTLRRMRGRLFKQTEESVVVQPNETKPSPPLVDGDDDDGSASEESTADAASSYIDLERRLRSRSSLDLTADTDAILERDYFHNVRPIYDASEIVRRMTTRDGGEQYFSPRFDPYRENWRRLGAEGTMAGPFQVRCPGPVVPGPQGPASVSIAHVYLEGWSGTPSEDERKSSEWERAIALAAGRHLQASLHPKDGEPAPDLHQMLTVLGFPSTATFDLFIRRPAIKAAFSELWHACLRHLPDGDGGVLPATRCGRRPVALRVLYSRSYGGRCEYNALLPDKAGWGLACHLARFCLAVEKVCDASMLPPMRGQIPLLPGKVSSAVVAWGGIELARTLRCFQTGFPGRAPLIADTPSV
ncbi:hypothetical protein CCM_02745 [Cordyceps militaris CM01]|uniref:Uncharacterized protein n=1 Tax=Cordyceps militaris (strain CM01) TaxID=983644 RepID=G3JBG7_CORMM|nr:uncharacterized protein CCM_02745 [Cordyceps militaris CM01]EGX94474.1 hypothetical protein CCM_02745 [Cordyceps militaris CM01]